MAPTMGLFGGLGGGLGRTAIVGLIGAVGGAAIVLMSSPGQLLGGVPRMDAVMTAPGADVAVVDGDTLRLQQTVVRLQGVSAPPRGQACTRGDGTSYDCGAAAVAALAGLVRGQQVACHVRGRDDAGFPAATCDAGGTNLNRALVSGGWAQASPGTPPPNE